MINPILKNNNYIFILQCFILVFIVSCTQNIPNDDIGLLFVNNDSIGIVNPRTHITEGSHTSWNPSYEYLVHSTINNELLFSDFEIDSSGSTKLQPYYKVKIPDIKTDYKIAWRWTFSDDNEWMIVNRYLFLTHYLPHDERKKQDKEAVRIYWMGAINLKTGEATKFDFLNFNPHVSEHGQYKILGFRGQECLIKLNTSIYSINVENPNELKKILKVSDTFINISPNGKHLVCYDGSEGNVTITLYDIDENSSQILFYQPFSEVESYAQGGGLKVLFSQDSKVMFVKKYVWKDEKWEVTATLECIESRKILYQNTFMAQNVGPILEGVSRIKNRFFYFKPSNSEKDISLVVLEQNKHHIKIQEEKVPYLPSKRNYHLPPIWSPNALQIAWITEDSEVVIYSLKDSTFSKFEEIPKFTRYWKWAATNQLR